MVTIELALNQAGGVEEVINFELSKADFVDEGDGSHYNLVLYAPQLGIKCASKELVVTKVAGAPFDIKTSRAPIEDYSYELICNANSMAIGETKFVTVSTILLSNSNIFLRVEDSSGNNFTLKGYVKVLKLTV